jgi:hypothetical protein
MPIWPDDAYQSTLFLFLHVLHHLNKFVHHG